MNSRNLLIALLATTTLVLVTPALSQNLPEEDQWIVLGSDAAQIAGSRVAAMTSFDGSQPRFLTEEEGNGLTVARIGPRMAGVLHEVMHANFRRCGGYTVHPTREAALREKNNPIYRPGYQFAVGIFDKPLNQAASVNRALPRVSKSRIVANIHSLENLGSRYYQSSGGTRAATQIETLWTGYGGSRSDFSVQRVDHSWAQDSVIATIRGSTKPDEIVVIGGHLDSIHASNNNDAPGADDNASGIAVVSEILKVLAEINFKPQRTIKFMAYAAEEVGLRGSGEIATDYRRRNQKVVGVLQMDMTGYPGSNRHMFFVNDNVNPHATGFLKRLIAKYNGAGPHQITYGETTCGYACSDHASWTRNNYPSAFPFEARFAEYNRAIHSPRDRIANLDGTGTHQARFAKLGLEFAIELAQAGAAPPPQPRGKRYLFTTLRVISSSASRGCRANDWACMTRLCKADLRNENAWRGWAGCWKEGSKYTCNFECGQVATMR